MHPSTAAAIECTAQTAVPRALVLRSCRPHVFAAALAAFRQSWPGAHVSALSHPGHRASLAAHGVDTVIEVPGTRFGLLRLPLRLFAELRTMRFDVVMVPLMSGPFAAHLNLMLLAIACGTPRVAVFAPDLGLQERSRRLMWREVIRAFPQVIAARFDTPLALALMFAAWLTPRRKAAASTPKRVLHIITSWGVGGAQRQLAELVRHCPADRVSTDILVLAREDGDFSSSHLGGHGVRIRYASAWPRLAPTIREIGRLCREERYDLVHTWLFLANALGVAGARLAGTPRVISSVRNLSLWKRTWANRPWFRLADALSSRASDVVTVNGSALVHDHSRWALVRRRRIAVVPNGLSTKGLDIHRAHARRRLYAELAIPLRTTLVGAVGRLATEKDHQLLIDAWRIVAPRNAELLIVGDGPLRASLQAQIDQSGLPIRLLGESDRAREIIAALDLFVLPSRIEGFPNVLLEAAMLGVPVIATDTGASRDVVMNEEDLVPVGNVDALASTLAAHLATPDAPTRRAFGRRLFVRRTFTIDRMVERWLALYDGAAQ
jgi:glycosyltransferase involved in cell wall biosynthesis